VRRFDRWSSAGLAVLVLTGCATGHARTSQPRVPQPKTSASQPGSLSEYMQKLRHLSTARPVTKTEAADSLETRDPAIAAQLLQVSSQPTADGYLALAERYRERGILDAAYRNFNRAVALRPQDGDAYEGLARVWRDWGLPELALGDAHRAVYYASGSASARNTLGTVLQALGKYEEARAAYQAAARMDPQSAYAVNNLCYLAFVRGHTDAAIDTCQRALTLEPSMPAARHNLALALAAAGRLDLARAQFDAGGDGASAAYNTGIVRLAAGDAAGALSAFDEASRMNPLHHLARERARQIRAQQFVAARKAADDQRR